MQQTKNNKKKEEEDKKKGIELRDKAMETLKRSKLSIFEIFCDIIQSAMILTIA